MRPLPRISEPGHLASPAAAPGSTDDDVRKKTHTGGRKAAGGSGARASRDSRPFDLASLLRFYGERTTPLESPFNQGRSEGLSGLADMLGAEKYEA
ncbi:MAG: hypothetical protein OXH52_22135 [Gammaproteobacteria bacterium]|nr:hypothetical protein [Gammaproteobacteria bacterium]